jgi:hypothetical protein
MTLDPATYTCPTHQTNLTDQVLEQLEDDDEWPIAFEPKIRQPEFEVVVTCPGGGTAHPVTCRGIRRP